VFGPYMAVAHPSVAIVVIAISSTRKTWKMLAPSVRILMGIL
jgi:hypothetical protein